MDTGKEYKRVLPGKYKLRSLDSCCKPGVEEAGCEGGQTSEQRPGVERWRPPQRGAAWRETGEPGRRPGPRARGRGLRQLPPRVTQAVRQHVSSTQTSSLNELRPGLRCEKLSRGPHVDAPPAGQTYAASCGWSRSSTCFSEAEKYSHLGL